MKGLFIKKESKMYTIYLNCSFYRFMAHKANIIRFDNNKIILMTRQFNEHSK